MPIVLTDIYRGEEDLEQNRRRLSGLVSMQAPSMRIPSASPERSSLLQKIVSRLEERLAKEPGQQPVIPKAIRGNIIAQTYVIEALVQHSGKFDLSFFSDAATYQQFENWAAQTMARMRGEGMKVIHPGEVFYNRRSILQPDFWLDLNGNLDLPQRVRLQNARSPYPLISLQHGLSDPGALYQHYLRTLLTVSYPSDSLLCTSSAAKTAMENILRDLGQRFHETHGVRLSFNGRIDKIPLCVDTDRYRPQDKATLRRLSSIEPTEVVLLYLGYISLVKADLLPLLQVVRRLHKKIPRMRLIIAGTGPDTYSRSLEKYIADMQLESVVSINRDVDDAEKFRLLGLADIFVAPCDTLTESFGLTPVEAMACGLPQVAADWSGYRESIVHGQTGLLIPTTWGRADQELAGSADLFGWSFDHIALGQSVSLDIDSLEKAIELLATNEPLRREYSARSRRRAEDEFSYRVFCRRFSDLLGDLIEALPNSSVDQSIKHFQSVHYYDNFKHYASGSVAGASQLETVDCETLPVNELLAYIEGESGSPMFDHETLLQLIDSVRQAPVPYTTVDQLVSAHVQYPQGKEHIVRHILFLLKHGCLRLKPDVSSTAKHSDSWNTITEQFSQSRSDESSVLSSAKEKEPEETL